MGYVRDWYGCHRFTVNSFLAILYFAAERTSGKRRSSVVIVVDGQYHRRVFGNGEIGRGELRPSRATYHTSCEDIGGYMDSWWFGDVRGGAAAC